MDRIFMYAWDKEINQTKPNKHKTVYNWTYMWLNHQSAINNNNKKAITTSSCVYQRGPRI